MNFNITECKFNLPFTNIVSLATTEEGKILFSQKAKDPSVPSEKNRARTTLNAIKFGIEKGSQFTCGNDFGTEKISDVAQAIYARYETRYNESWQSFIDKFTCCFGGKSDLEKMHDLLDEILMHPDAKIDHIKPTPVQSEDDVCSAIDLSSSSEMSSDEGISSEESSKLEDLDEVKPMAVCSNTTHQVFIRGFDSNELISGSARIYTANVDFEKATTDDLFQKISFRTGIQMPLLQYQFRILRAGGEQLISHLPLASQGVNKEDTLHLEWRVGLFENKECPICFEEVSYVARRLLFCQQELENGTVQMQHHQTAFHVKCIEPLKKDGEITCPLCRGKVTADAMVIP